MGAFEDPPGLDLDEVTPLRIVVLDLCLEAYIQGLPTPAPAAQADSPRGLPERTDQDMPQ